ncbi:GH1 family beta-glucosidase [Bosea sp. 117]|uniref:GH1 family beta-glucosidase n=1 Tax=Bosea sp. 117 TaxID=1125973 RepID=UPI00049485F1|nr:GH1 family beta-glucosidase [Bosea sp. 117]
MIRRRDLLAAAAAATALPLLPRTVHAEFALPEAELPKLPRGFVWGASTSSYQIEGAVAADGRAPSVWDGFCRQPGRIADGTNGDVACDHYNRYREDVDLLADGGFGAYRFSIAWPRVMPQGTGAVNAAGLDFYDRLTDRLMEKGVTPWACLYHWDLPQALQDRGGWHNRDIASWFADYARATTARLGDRVKNWAMFNEPSVHAIFGHAFGNHAPGQTGWASYVMAQHHQNLAQGTAIRALRAENRGWNLGTVLSLQPVHPASDREIDAKAAQRFDAAWNTVNLDPLFHGRYPEIVASSFAPLVKAGDLDTIKAPIDFLGVNYYGRAHIVDDPACVLSGANFGPLPKGTPTTAMGWPVEPDGLVEVLARLRDGYGNPPVYITENGACYDDPAPQDGKIDDAPRVAFLREHLAAAGRAIAQGCALKGYFVWSLLDNFEWAEGKRRRFGIVHVDFETLARTPKASYAFLSQVMRQAG